MPKPDVLTVGALSYARIDCPDDVWRYAIVRDYRDSQTYGEILMAFAPEFEPDREVLQKMMEALQ